jgi:hypothetical protein
MKLNVISSKINVSHAGSTNFEVILTLIEDYLFAMEHIDIELNVPIDKLKKFQELQLTGKWPQYEANKYLVENLPAFRHINPETGERSSRICTSMQVLIRMVKNIGYIPGKTPEYVPVESPFQHALDFIHRNCELVEEE